MAGVLDGIRVFDLTLAAVGPWSAKLLGQLGADVIHVEGPEPELAHHIPPTVRGTGVLYLAANTNKRSVVLDLKRDDDRERALELAASCDVFIQNMRPGAVGRLGLGYDAVAARRPDIVYVSASAYGRVGPMAAEAGVDPLVQAFCGWTSVTGARGSSGELFRHYAHLDLTTSSMVVEAVLAALAVRDRDGTGQHVELEMLAAALSLQTSRLAEYVATGVAPVPLGSAAAVTAPHQAFRCSDGRWLTIGVERDDQWPRLCAALGATELAEDRRLDTNAGRLARRDELAAAIGAVMATRPSAWWALRCSRHGVPHARPSDFDELRHHPQVRANGHLTDVNTERYGALTLDGLPWHFAATPADPPRPGADPGTHTAEVLAELDAATATSPSSGVGSPGRRPAGTGPLAPPLDGVVVVELAEGQAGAFAAARLGDLGAEVIKIERPGGDPVRGHGPELGTTGTSAVFAALNRNKRSVVLDLDDTGGRELARRLLASADVVIEALPPGEADRHGLTHEACSTSGPGPVWVAVSGWGEQGPMASQPAAELPVQAMAEYLASLGRIGDEPVRLGADVAATNTAIFASQAALAGLRTRAATGRSQRVAVSMLGVLLHLRGIMWAARSNPDDWYGFHLDHYTNPPECGYRTADGRVQFGLRRGNSEDFDRLMIRLGLLDRLDDPHFADFGRQAAPLGRHAVEAKPVWEQAFASMTTAEVVDELHARGGDAVPVTDYPAILAHPQVAAIGALVDVDQPGWGPLRSVAPVWRFAVSPASVRCGAPALGADTAAVLARLGAG
jgi:crotonobetainyl-CoA:carnitine CoA-transferase CaiB-like acyl-CoA transferase